MTAPVSVRRVTVIAPSARVDVSLPAQSTVAELVPALVRMTAGEKAGVGWRLGRLGADAFDDSSTVAGVGVRDGEVLFLNPRSTSDDRVVVDDIADTIASAAAEPSLNWRPALTRAIAITAIVVAFGGAAVGVAVAAPSWPLATTVDGLLAVGLLLAAAVVGRAVHDTGSAAALGGAGMVAILLAGVALFAVDRPLWIGAGPMAVACAALTLYALIAAVAVGAFLGWFVAAGLAALTGCAAALAVTIGARPVSVAAVVAAGALAITPTLPMTALRLSRLGLPRVPADAAGFRVDEPPVDRTEVSANSRAAASVLGALFAAVALVCVGAALVLLGAGTTWARALAGATGLALLLRSRAYKGVGQRAALVAGGGSVLLLVAGTLAARGEWAVAGAGGVALGIAGLAYALRAPKNQPSPYWGRLLEVVEFVTIVSLVPLAAAVLDLYQTARSLAG